MVTGQVSMFEKHKKRSEYHRKYSRDYYYRNREERIKKDKERKEEIKQAIKKWKESESPLLDLFYDLLEMKGD